ncbi:MAG TPA: hypothetical protein VLS89_06140, partial [Candidatus Nanopelagicales bacterium]|nr:hypothetical protein [Candidatus Nanopelagicales bacterium]
TGLVMSPSAEVTASIADGSFTVMVQIDALGADTEYNPLAARLHVGADLGMAPTWSGNDEWPIVPEFLNDPTDPNSSKVQFPSSYLVENTWVSGTNTNLNLNIAVGGYNLSLPITNAVFAMDISDDRSSAANGTIAGVLPTEQLIAELEKIVGAIQPELCEGSAAENLYNLIRNASDIMADGSQDPNQTCNGISIGIGFSAKRVRLGAIAPASTPGEDPCAAAPAGG